MATMLASKGRFLVLVGGLLAIAVYLGIALSWIEGLPKAQFAENKSEQPTAQADDAVIEVEEKSDEPNVDRPNVDEPKVISVPAAQSDVKAGKSNGAAVGQITTQTSKADSEPDSRTLTVTADPAVKVASKPGNPLDDSIDPDVPGIAKLALIADFRSLVESGVDVSTAVRFIDERVDGGKYGDEIIRK